MNSLKKLFCILFSIGFGNVLASIDESEEDLSLYKGNDIEGFLGLCDFQPYGIKNDAFDEYYKNVHLQNETARCNILAKGTYEGMEDDEMRAFVFARFQTLRKAQNTIREYYQKLSSPNYRIHYGCLIILSSLGLILIIFKHYRIPTLFDNYHPDSSYGMPGWQYLKLRYMAVKVKGKITDKKKTVRCPAILKSKTTVKRKTLWDRLFKALKKKLMKEKEET